MTLDIIHEEEGFLLVNKPSGMLAVPGRGPDKADSISTRVKERYPDAPSHPAVHRLDMDTSGLMLLATESDAHRTLSKQFEDRKIEKRYIALLDGILKGDKGTIELPFRLDVDNRPIQIYDEVHGKIGITHWEKMSIENNLTRITFTPITGRTHQLRVHAAHEKGLGISIVGDPFYGNGTGPGQLKLHASELSFDHPYTQKRLHFKSDPPF